MFPSPVSGASAVSHFDNMADLERALNQHPDCLDCVTEIAVGSRRYSITRDQNSTSVRERSGVSEQRHDYSDSSAPVREVRIASILQHARVQAFIRQQARQEQVRAARSEPAPQSFIRPNLGRAAYLHMEIPGVLEDADVSSQSTSSSGLSQSLEEAILDSNLLTAARAGLKLRKGTPYFRQSETREEMDTYRVSKWVADISEPIDPPSSPRTPRTAPPLNVRFSEAVTVHDIPANPPKEMTSADRGAIAALLNADDAEQLSSIEAAGAAGGADAAEVEPSIFTPRESGADATEGSSELSAAVIAEIFAALGDEEAAQVLGLSATHITSPQQEDTASTSSLSSRDSSDGAVGGREADDEFSVSDADMEMILAAFDPEERAAILAQRNASRSPSPDRPVRSNRSTSSESRISERSHVSTHPDYFDMTDSDDDFDEDDLTSAEDMAAKRRE